MYDPATGRTGVLQAILPAEELIADRSTAPGKHVAFLRPEGGGVEWLADATTLQHPDTALLPPP
ncbi:hypothetical protein AQ490_25005 [Wenjunlia vitaminophila]|uniref:Uncharacterized protein n=1 Tax=Wenjunlia vitaminophila TaxID=76728 RepID=A0A0T6LQX7_WENVI|nr:hypothetical protein [Wenjunlia vitaminophila]KRV48531.1 hypothetical protein AQ490_25005 [Wenjunlia vitaminophila]